MKKLICAVIAVLLLVSACAAETVDLSKYTDAQVLELLTLVQQEVVDRKLSKTARLSGGEYIAGEDIPAGKYVFTCSYKGYVWANFTVYSDRGSGKQKIWELITEDDGVFSRVITLDMDDQLKCDQPFTLSVYTGISFN